MALDDYEVRVVDAAGTVYGVLAGVDDSLSFSWALNAPGDAQIAASTFDPAWPTLLRTTPSTGELKMLDREVQVWRKGVLLWQGKPTRAATAGPMTTVQAASLEWLLRHSNFGPIQRNWLVNPDFEMGDLTGWTASGPTATVQNVTVQRGKWAAQLYTASSGQESYLYQRVAIPSYPTPQIHILAAWAFLALDYGGPPNLLKGLYLQQNGNPGNNAFGEITNSTGVAQWVRLSTAIIVPANTPDTLEVRLYSPGGTVIWDDVALTFLESVSSEVTGSDLGIVGDRIAQYLNDPTQGRSSANAVNLRFGVYDPSSNTIAETNKVGLTETLTYQFNQHASVIDSLNEWALNDWCDYAIVPAADGKSRTLVLYPGRRGRFHPEVVVAVDANMTDGFTWAYDGEQAGSQVRVLGAGGGGSDQEVGVAVDTTLTGGTPVASCTITHAQMSLTTVVAPSNPGFTQAMVGQGVYHPALPLSTTIASYNSPSSVTLSSPALVDATAATVLVGGLILDVVQSAPMETTIAGLTARAQTECKRLRGPVLAATVKVRDRGDIIGVVYPGDTIQAQIAYGWVNVTAPLRIATMKVNARDETVELGLMLPGPTN